MCKEDCLSGEIKTKKRGRRRMTVKQKLYSFFVRRGGFIHLSLIYKTMKAETSIAKAGIRGLLNKGLGKTGSFIRNKKVEGEYRAA